MQEADSKHENPIVQSLEALLQSEDAPDSTITNKFDEMRTRGSRVLTNNKGSGYFPNLSFTSQPLPSSMNTSIQNQSTESGYISESFDGYIHTKPLVKNVSFDGCFVEDDSSASFGDKDCGVHQLWRGGNSRGLGILSSAVSQGGDISNITKTFHPITKVLEAYSMVKYSHTLNECWKKLDGVCKMHHLLAEKRVNPDYPSAPGNLGSLLDAFKNEIIQIFTDLVGSKKQSRLGLVLDDIQTALDLMYSDAVNSAISHQTLAKQLRSLLSNLYVTLYSECVLQNAPSTPAEDKFRLEKRFQIWNSMA